VMTLASNVGHEAEENTVGELSINQSINSASLLNQLNMVQPLLLCLNPYKG